MNAETVDAGAELREPVEAGLTRSPVVALEPVLAQVPEVAEGDALRPVIHRLRIRPACPAQPLPQVVQVSFGDLYAKRDDLRTHRGNLTYSSLASAPLTSPPLLTFPAPLTALTLAPIGVAPRPAGCSGRPAGPRAGLIAVTRRRGARRRPGEPARACRCRRAWRSRDCGR